MPFVRRFVNLLLTLVIFPVTDPLRLALRIPLPLLPQPMVPSLLRAHRHPTHSSEALLLKPNYVMCSPNVNSFLNSVQLPPVTGPSIPRSSSVRPYHALHPIANMHSGWVTYPTMPLTKSSGSSSPAVDPPSLQFDLHTHAHQLESKVFISSHAATVLSSTITLTPISSMRSRSPMVNHSVPSILAVSHWSVEFERSKITSRVASVLSALVVCIAPGSVTSLPPPLTLVSLLHLPRRTLTVLRPPLPFIPMVLPLLRLRRVLRFSLNISLVATSS